MRMHAWGACSSVPYTYVLWKPRSSTAIANSIASRVPSPFLSYLRKMASSPLPCWLATESVHRKYSSISIVPEPSASMLSKSSFSTAVSCVPSNWLRAMPSSFCTCEKAATNSFQSSTPSPFASASRKAIAASRATFTARLVAAGENDFFLKVLTGGDGLAGGMITSSTGRRRDHEDGHPDNRSRTLPHANNIT